MLKNQRLIRLLIFFFFAFSFLPLGAEEKLTVDGDLTVKSADTGPPRYGLVIKPQGSEPANATEGQLYYNDDGNEFYYRDDTTVWKRLVGGDKYVATKIVAASDSLDTTCADGVCTNPKTDYVCNGIDEANGGIEGGDQKDIQSAIDALGSNPGAVYLLEGTYKINGSINFNTTTPNDSGKALIGTGRGTVLKVVADTNFYVIYAYSVNRILISQLMIDGDRGVRSGEDWGIYFYAVTNSKIDKVWVENIAGTTTGGAHHAICITSSSSNNIISNCNLRNSPYGILMGGNCSNNIITNNNVQDNVSTGIYLWSSTPNNNNNVIANNNVQGNGGYGIYIVGSDSNIISNNNVQGNTSVGIFLSYTGTNTSDSNTIAHNNIQGGTYGIYLQSSSQNLISGNNMQDSNTYGIYVLASSSKNTITGNIIYNALGLYGIALNNNSNTNIISSNRIYKETGDSSNYGIRIADIAPISDNNYLISNLIDGAAYIGSGYDRRIKDEGTNTKYTDKMKMTLERVVVAPVSLTPLEVTTSPKGYIALNPSASVTLNNPGVKAISDGKVSGDTIILEGASSSYAVTINSSPNIIFNPNNPLPRILDQDDTLTLLWNGSAWVEVGWSDN